MAAKSDPDVLTAAKSGDARRALVALRDGLAKAFDAADVNLKPQISGQLRAVLADLAALPAQEKASAVDEIRARREARRGAAPSGDVAAGAGKQRRPRSS